MSLRISSDSPEHSLLDNMIIRCYFIRLREISALELGISYSYTMGCPPVRGDNPRALASGLSYVQMDKHGITI